MKTIIINQLGELFVMEETGEAGCINTSELAARIGREPTAEDFNAEFMRQAVEIAPEYADIIKLVWDAQAEHNDSFIRASFYNYSLIVECEFRIFDDDMATRRRMYELACEINAEIVYLHRDEHSDRSGVQIVPGDNWDDSNIKWTEGPDHGRAQTQYAVRLQPAHTPESIAENVAILAEQMQEFFESEAGIGVI